ncbi:MAG: LemA family protein [Terriglobia bacterium]
MALDIGIAILVIIVVAAVAFYLLSLRAALIRMQNEALRALSNLETQIKQRNDLIPTLIETCRGYMGPGEGVLQAVAETRNAFGKAKTPAEKGACEQVMRQRLIMLFQEVERHRELRVNNNYQRLRARFAEIGRKVDGNRVRLNQAVERYNQRLGDFPGSWVARWLSLKPKLKFELPEADALKPNPR